MDSANTNKRKSFFTRSRVLLALPVALSVLTGVARVQSSPEIQAVFQPISAMERVFQSDWGSADPSVYSRIALAFSSETMNGVDLKRLECRRTLCKVVYEADSDLEINRILPRQLAASFNATVTLHAGEDSDHETLVYLDVPSST
jgi:hypothetical protein